MFDEPHELLRLARLNHEQNENQMIHVFRYLGKITMPVLPMGAEKLFRQKHGRSDAICRQ
jgi:hypothetical protein